MTATLARLRLLLVPPLLLPLPAAQPEVKDSVFLKDGKSESGRIQSEEYGALTLAAAKGPPKKIPWDSVRSVQYGGSAPFSKASDAFSAGQVEEALPQLEGLRQDAKLRPVLRQQVLYFWALAQQRLGKVDEALAGYQALLKEFPKSRFLRAVGENLVAGHLAKKDAAGGERAVDQFLADALAAGVDSGFLNELRVLKARLLEGQEKYAEAMASYSILAGAGGVSAAAVQEATLGQARCLQKQGKATDAEPLYRKLLGEDAPNFVLAGAWNGLSDILSKQAKDKRDAEALRDALFGYLRAVIQYGPLAGETTIEYERGLAGAAKCFRFLSELETNADRKKLYLDRARERLSQLKREFPGSPFLQD
ncbi:MAG TPA: tetratricopeptide repeat protein [Planctomycetota bacterium]|jgi:tetratricopeptide (TPR) repeat protein|nr:tetratricopeptide repeat protein [Planctomycetota bacterium]